MRRILMMALAGAAVATAAAPAYAQSGPPTLHGFCTQTAPNCADNGTNTPTTNNPASFTFTAGGHSADGTLLIDILVPNNVTLPTSYTFTGAYSGTATLFDANGAASGTPAWTTGQLQDYLGLPSGTTPANPIDAYLPATQGYDSGATGFYVFQATIDNATLPSNSGASASDLMLLGQGLAQGSYITAFLGQNGVYGATAPSGAILETAPPVPEPATWAMMLLGFGGIGMAVRRSNRRRSGALMQVA